MAALQVAIPGQQLYNCEQASATVAAELQGFYQEVTWWATNYTTTCIEVHIPAQDLKPFLRAAGDATRATFWRNSFLQGAERPLLVTSVMLRHLFHHASHTVILWICYKNDCNVRDLVAQLRQLQATTDFRKNVEVMHYDNERSKLWQYVMSTHILSTVFIEEVIALVLGGSDGLWSMLQPLVPASQQRLAHSSLQGLVAKFARVMCELTTLPRQWLVTWRKYQEYNPDTAKIANLQFVNDEFTVANAAYARTNVRDLTWRVVTLVITPVIGWKETEPERLVVDTLVKSHVLVKET